MARMPWGVYLWPGLPQLWKYGAWAHLATTAGFAILLNVAILGTFLWTELLSPGVRTSVWLAVVVGWTGSAVFSLRWIRNQEDETGPTDDRYREAQDHYLKGNWFEAERLLVGQLRRNPRDLDCRLMLATLLRHVRRFDEAAWHLDRLQRLEGSEKWSLEIRREWELLSEARQGEAEVIEEPAGTAATDGKTPVKDAA